MARTEDIRAAIDQLDNWIVKHDYQAYDPFDGLNAWLRPLAIGKLGRQLLLQGVKRFPWNLRPLLGIRSATSSKAMGYFARGYLKLYQATGDTDWRRKARYCLDWLKAHPSPGYEHLCWGNHFDYQSRGFYLPKGEPTVVWTALIGHAFLDAWEILGDERDLEAAKSVCRFILNDLEHHPEGRGVCISYIPGGYYPVHNSNMLAAAVLARTYSHTQDESLRQVASEAVAYTVNTQRADGAWWYGEADNLRWVDNFHTGYVLDSLWWYMASTDDWQYRPVFERGARFFVENFFLDDGTPKYYPDRTYPIDIQCAAQAIETLTLLAREWDTSCWALAEKVANWTIANMQDSDGHFYFRRGCRWANRTPMLHWGQATMLHALACLISSKLTRGRRSDNMREKASQNILKAERLFFNRFFSTGLEGDLHQDPDWPRTFPATQSAFEIGSFNILQKLGDLRGKRVLEIGCGSGRLVTAILYRGGECDAIDISEVAVELTKKRAVANGFKHGYRLFCTPAESFVPLPNYYDYVVGEAVLHHLQDYALVGAHIFDTLKNNGKAIFVENVCHNSVINLLRKIKHNRMDPQKISPAEKGVDLDRDIGQQLAQPFGGYHVEGQFLFYLAWRVTMNENLLRGCFMLDKMFSRSFLAKYYGIVLIELTK